MVKRLIAFYSRTGNTRKVAGEIAANIKADVDEIRDQKNRRGITGWLIAGKDATLDNPTKIKTLKSPKSYDLIIIGTPIWAFTIVPAIRTYLMENKGKFKKVAFFSTSGSSGVERTFGEMERLSKKPLSTLSLEGTNFSQILDLKKGDNLQKIKDFCNKIKRGR